MADLVNKIISHSGSKDVHELRKFLDMQNERIGKMNEPDYIRLLPNISPTNHTLGYIRLLYHFARKPEKKELAAFGNFAKNLFMNGNPTHINADKHKIYTIGRALSEICILTNPMNGIIPLKSVIVKLCDGRPNHLTPLHTKLALLCILSKAYDSGLEATSAPMYQVESRRNGMLIEDYLAYHYYAGKIACVLKKFEKALEHFQAVLSAPTDNCVSAIQIEAYKKYTLVSLLVHGKTTSSLKTASSMVLNRCENAAKPYKLLATQFEASVGAAKLGKVAEEQGKKEFEKDENWGLVKQVVRALTKMKIQRLNKTYVTLSLEDIAKKAELKDAQEAERYVTEMIFDGSISAVVSQREGMVSFLDEQLSADTNNMADRLKAKIQEAFSLSAKLKSMERKLEVHPNFVRKQMQGEMDGTRYEKGSGGGFNDINVDPALRHVLEKSKTEM